MRGIVFITRGRLRLAFVPTSIEEDIEVKAETEEVDVKEEEEEEEEEEKEEEEEEKGDGICANTGCVLMYMPQFRTFTLND